MKISRNQMFSEDFIMSELFLFPLVELREPQDLINLWGKDTFWIWRKHDNIFPFRSFFPLELIASPYTRSTVIPLIKCGT